jgi:hypothetical protein
MPIKEVLLSESEVLYSTVLTPLINSCKPDAKKKGTPTSVIDGGPKNQPVG